MTSTVAPTATATLAEVAALLRWAHVVALDLETTGLDPRRDRIRLLTLGDGERTVILDCFEHDIRQVLPWLTDKMVICHHAAFDLGFLWAAGLRELPEIVDTFLLSRLLAAGTTVGSSLAECCQRFLDVKLPKELQTSDWSGTLSAAQLCYARKDVEVLPPLFRRLRQDISQACLDCVADVELHCLPAWVWLRETGVPFDRAKWQTLAERAATAKTQLGQELQELAPYCDGPGLFGDGVSQWNWDSPQQVKAVLAQLGSPVQSTNDTQLALLDTPVAEKLREYRHQAQLVKMYGTNWLAKAHIVNDRIYPDWRQLGTDTGRTSCTGPNLQQVPRDEDPQTKRVVYRECFRPPVGRVLIKADYAALQMRIAVKHAKDAAMLKVFQTHGDPHTATAQALLGKQEVTKQERQIAKSANFALLFGAGAEGLRLYAKTTFGLNFTQAEAEKHRAKFFQVYHGLAQWHADTRNLKVSETRSTLGRRRLLCAGTPDTERLNSPVQGDEADGLKRALALLWHTRAKCPSAVPVLAVHDEIVMEADHTAAEQVAVWLKECMMQAMTPILDPVPCEVEVNMVPTWGG